LIFGSKPNLLSDNIIVENLESGASFVRWGDGETAIARGKQIGYQAGNVELQGKLIQLLQIRNENLIIGVPWSYYASPLDPKWSKRTFRILFSTRVFLLGFIQLQVLKLGRTEFFWNTNYDLKDLLTSICKKRKVLLVASDKKFLERCPNGTEFFQIPDTDAFDDYSNILMHIRKWVSFHEDGETSILLAAGPTSKALVLDLVEKTQLIDVGHGFRFSLYGEGKWAWSKT
jgi:hypothetical protein